MIGITLSSDANAKVHLKCYDAANPKVVFTSRYKTLSKEPVTLHIRMPVSPKKVIVELKSASKFTVEKVRKKELLKRVDVIDFGRADVREFARFAIQFSYNLDSLPVDKQYTSANDQFAIRLYNVLYKGSGRVSSTPARVSKRTGIIEVSKQAFERYTFPMRFAILCHEFSHYYMNEDAKNETEADLNGLLIYLGLGFPRIEAYEAFLQVFIGTPSEQNKQRYDIINNFIKDFEKQQIIIE